MAIPALDSFSALGEFQNFERDAFATKKEMREFNEDFLPEQFVSICYEDASIYYYNKKNTVDPETGKWRKYSGEGTTNNAAISFFEIGGMEGTYKFGDTVLVESITAEVIDGTEDKVVSVNITDGADINEEFDKAGNFTIEVNKDYGAVDDPEETPDDVLFTITVKTESGKTLLQHKKIVFEENFIRITEDEITEIF